MGTHSVHTEQNRKKYIPTLFPKSFLKGEREGELFSKKVPPSLFLYSFTKIFKISPKYSL